MTPSVSIEAPSDALIEVMTQRDAHGDAQLGRIAQVGRAVYELEVGDLVYVVRGWRRNGSGEHMRVPQADFNCLRLPLRAVQS